MRLSSNVIGDSNDENNFPNKLLLTNRQVSKIRKALANGSSANMDLSKTQLHKIGQLGGFLCNLLRPLLKLRLSLKGSVLKESAKRILMPLGVTAAASATDAAIRKKMFESGMHHSNLAEQTTLIIYNK